MMRCRADERRLVRERLAERRQVDVGVALEVAHRGERVLRLGEVRRGVVALLLERAELVAPLARLVAGVRHAARHADLLALHDEPRFDLMVEAVEARLEEALGLAEALAVLAILDVGREERVAHLLRDLGIEIRVADAEHVALPITSTSTAP